MPWCSQGSYRSATPPAATAIIARPSVVAAPVATIIAATIVAAVLIGPALGDERTTDKACRSASHDGAGSSIGFPPVLAHSCVDAVSVRSLTLPVTGCLADIVCTGLRLLHGLATGQPSREKGRQDADSHGFGFRPGAPAQIRSDENPILGWHNACASAGNYSETARSGRFQFACRLPSHWPAPRSRSESNPRSPRSAPVTAG